MDSNQKKSYDVMLTYEDKGINISTICNEDLANSEIQPTGWEPCFYETYRLKVFIYD
jgi:hypothetical protein